MAKTPWALRAKGEPPTDTAHPRFRGGGAAGSAPIGLVLDSAGRSCPPFSWLLLLLGRCWSSGAASLFHRTGCPGQSRGGARSPLRLGFVPSSEIPAAAAPPSPSRQPPPPPSPWTRGRLPLEQRSGGGASPKATPTWAPAEAILGGGWRWNQARGPRGRIPAVADRMHNGTCSLSAFTPVRSSPTQILSLNPQAKHRIWPSRARDKYLLAFLHFFKITMS